MTVAPDASARLAPWIDSGRIVAMAGAPGPGPDVVIVGGLHGNEPEGIGAGRAVVEAVARSSTSAPARIALFSGNIAALRARQRFLERDLNRGWTEEAIARARLRHRHERSREDREQLDLIACFEAFAEDAPHGLILLDLHTMSAGAPPFSVIIDSPTNRALASSVGNPVILGFESYVQAPILTWCHARGWHGVGVEGGSCGDTAAEAHLAQAVWRILGALEWPHEDARAAESAGTFHRLVHRQAVVPGSGFHMDPGFESFQRVRAGDPIARDCAGPIRAMCDGLMFMPLYQTQGSDGFFLLAPADQSDV